MLATLLLVLPAAPAAFVVDAADDQYQFIVGLADKGLHEMVVTEAEAFLRDYAGHAKADLARYRLGIALFELGRLADARPHFQALAQREGFEFRSESSFRLGQCALEAGDDGAAAAAFESVVRAGTPYLLTPANFLLGEARFRSGDYEAAQGAYERALAAEDAGTYAADAAHGLAWCAFRLEHYDDAVRRVQDFLQRFPKDPRTAELRFLAGECHLESGRPGPALSAYRSVEGGPFHDAALRGAGFAAAAAGDHAAAAEWFGRLLDEHPDSRYVAEAALHRGIHLLEAGDAAGAARVLAGDQVERGPETSYWLGRALARSGEGELALAALDAGLQDDSADEELRGRLLVARGDVLFELGRADEAARSFESAGSAYALHAAAVARLNEGEHAEAVRLARAVLAQGDNAYALEAQLTLGEGLLALGDTAPAEEAFQVVYDEAEAPARRSHALTRIGWCRYLAGEPAEAAARFAEVGRSFPEGPDSEEALFMEARAGEDAGAADDARRAYASYVQRFPAGAHLDEALLRVARLEPGTAGEARLERLLADTPDSPLVAQAHFDLAERLVESERTTDAEPHYRAVLEQHPSDPLVPAAAYGLAWCRTAADDHAGAAELLAPVAFDEAVDPGVRASALELLVWARQRLGDADGARAAYQALADIVDDEPRRFRAARAAAQALVDAERGDEAGALYADLLRRTEDPDVALGILVERAYLALDAGALDQAESHVRAALRYRPDDRKLAEAVFFVGEARFAAGEDAQAAELYDAAAAPGPPEDASSAAGGEPSIGERALYKGGFARLRAEDPDGAAERFARLVETYPASSLLGETLFLLGEAHYRAGRYAEAIPPLERVRTEVPQHEVRPKALFRLGLALARTEAWREASEVLAELVQRYPDFANATEAELWRGRALAGLGERRNARAAFQRVVEGDRGVLSAQARIELGRLALGAGERDEALSEFLKVAVLYAHPEEVAEALYMAGQILETMGDGERAIAQYREILETYPDARFARPARERLRDLEP